ncbi:MAG TPA: hypothetical protein VHM26_16530 [Chitinophagaceae bacterium]|nr:hypothetical protein [Chitinophagaceae bacterium]
MRLLLLLIPFSFVLSACPYESTVPLEPHPVEPVDSTLLGYWYGIVKDGSDFFGIEALDITQKSDSTYSIIRYGKAAKGDIILPDTAYFTGYISYIGDQRFMNIEGSVVTAETRGRNKPPVVKTNKVFYIANFNMQNDTLSMRTVTENFSPNRTIFNTGMQLKQAIIDLTDQKKNIYDDLYTLSYRKIPRPQPMKPF